MFCQKKCNAAQWNLFKTKYINLQYQSIQDLKQFEKKIDFSDINAHGFSSLFRNKSLNEDYKDQLESKLTALIEKVQLILDMRTPVNVFVKIFPDKASLDKEYYNIYKSSKSLRAWYIFEYNTIYINVQDLYAGMFAHECAHAIIDHYMKVKPPRATAEILARYVDAHLHKEAKTY